MKKNCLKMGKYPRPNSEDIWTTYTKLKKIPCKAMELRKQGGLWVEVYGLWWLTQHNSSGFSYHKL